ncbi:hypothetical protein AAV94_06030 [Lampropedia cohaerens]|uniref:HTH tetR-type domain-containing protein n=2 Tax=Lampropedia cohaerens TaxID=1610491 RepID=A0A0U1Q0G7_9BURK|nr:hypothetical protein AAV94_06030 [Lampropedia cohaerens]
MRSSSSLDSPTATPMDAPRRVRVRMAPQLRRQQILDAALEQFSVFGVAGATMEGIAQRVGLTKAGLYAHFAGKDEIFETLVRSFLFHPMQQDSWRWQEADSLEEAVDRFLERVYALVHDARMQAIFRLLIAESARVPDLILRWHQGFIASHARIRQEELNEGIDRGLIADNPVSRDFTVVAAPALLALVTCMTLGGDTAAAKLAQIKAAHRHMLLVVLDPAAADAMRRTCGPSNEAAEAN